MSSPVLESVAEIELPATLPTLHGRTKLGEGAVWDPLVNRLLWIDIVKGKVFEYDYSSKTYVGYDVRQTIGTVVPHTETTVVGALLKGACVISRASGKGRLWVGSMGLFGDVPSGSLYSVDASGNWVKRISDVSISNGLVWSKDNKHFWFIDSVTGNIDHFDYDEVSGAIANRSTVLHLDAKVYGWPDGCAIDAEDKIWIAMWEGGCVLRIDPITGKILQKVTTPGASRTTSCAFGGPKMDQLFITTASCGISKERLATSEAHAGALFRLDLSGVGIIGLPGYVFENAKL